MTLASGFALNVKENGEEGEEETMIMTCADALEEVSVVVWMSRLLTGWTIAQIRSWPQMLSASTNARTK